MIDRLGRMLVWQMAGLCVAGLAGSFSSQAAQGGGAIASPETQVAAVHAYVARTRAWSRDDYTIEVLHGDAVGSGSGTGGHDDTDPGTAPDSTDADGTAALPTFRVTLIATSAPRVAFDDVPFDVMLDRRGGDVVGEHARPADLAPAD